jgi:DNA-binding transcriptional regulator LsrR (DeoR family)
VDDVAAMPTVIAVAGDTRKAAAILGALRAGVLHVLVTDEATARAVMRLDDQDRMVVVADGRVSP